MVVKNLTQKKKNWNQQSGLIYTVVNLQKWWENNQNWFSWKGLREFYDKYLKLGAKCKNTSLGLNKM